MVRILTKQLVDGKEVTFQIAHQPRNIIDCDVESEDEGGLLGGADQLKGLFSELKAAVNNEEDEKQEDGQGDQSEDDSLYAESYNEELDDVNQASSQIKQAIKYKLINNLFKEYVG